MKLHLFRRFGSKDQFCFCNLKDESMQFEAVGRLPAAEPEKGSQADRPVSGSFGVATSGNGLIAAVARETVNNCLHVTECASASFMSLRLAATPPPLQSLPLELPKSSSDCGGLRDRQ